jgi:hypothetical protein
MAAIATPRAIAILGTGPGRAAGLRRRWAGFDADRDAGREVEARGLAAGRGEDPRPARERAGADVRDAMAKPYPENPIRHVRHTRFTPRVALCLDNHRHDHRAPAVVGTDPTPHRAANSLLEVVDFDIAISQGVLQNCSYLA